MTKYRIRWQAKFTKATGHGTASFPHEQAQLIADELNESKSGKLCYHTVEPVPESEQETENSAA